MKIAVSKIRDINSKCSNDFTFNLHDFSCGIKSVTKRIKLSEDQFIEASLYFKEEYKNYRKTGNNIPVLHVSICTKSPDSTFYSSGMGVFHHFNDRKVNRKNMNVLTELTKEVSDDMIRGLARENVNDSILNVIQQ